MRFTFALLVALTSLPVFAEDDVFAGLKRGELVQITVKDGGMFKGVVKSVVGDNLKLELRSDTGDVAGSMVFEKADIRKIVRLGMAKEPTPKEKPDEVEKPKDGDKPKNGEEPKNGGEPKNGEKEPTAEERATAAVAKFPPPDWSEARKAEIEAMDEWKRSEAEREFLACYADWQAGMEIKAKESRRELLVTYPPKDGWGEEKYKALKNMMNVLGRAMTAAEQEFVDRFEDWKKALAEFEEATKEPEPKKEEEPKEDEPK